MKDALGCNDVCTFVCMCMSVCVCTQKCMYSCVFTKRDDRIDIRAIYYYYWNIKVVYHNKP